MKKLIIVLGLISFSCSRSIPHHIHLPVDQKLVTATWEGSKLNYLTEPMPKGYMPQTKILVQKMVDAGTDIFEKEDIIFHEISTK